MKDSKSPLSTLPWSVGAPSKVAFFCVNSDSWEDLYDRQSHYKAKGPLVIGAACCPSLSSQRVSLCSG